MQSSLNSVSVIAGKSFALTRLLMLAASIVLPGISGCENLGSMVMEDQEVIREKQLEPYHTIWTYGLFDITLVQDSVHKVVISGRKGQVNNIHFSQHNRRIRVTEKSTNHWYSGMGKPQLEFHFKEMRYVRLEEPSTLTSQDTLHGKHLKLIVANELSGIDLQINTNSLYLENWTTNTGRFKIAGQCDDLRVQLTGSARLEAGNLHTREAFIRQESIGDVYIHTKDTLEVHSFARGHVYYYGNPEEIIFENSSSGELIGL